MGYALPVTIQMTHMECGRCGIKFSVPETWRAEKQQNGKEWYCPNGHAMVYSESDVEKAKKALAEEQRRHAATLSRLNESHAAEQKAVNELTRFKMRTNAGVCPCCNRTFQQLARHMKLKHPEVK